MKQVKQKVLLVKKDETKTLFDLEGNFANTAGGVDIPDPGDIPGGMFGSGEDLLQGVYLAWREKVIGEKLQAWIRLHQSHSS